MGFGENDFITLSSGAKHFRPWRPSTDDFDVVVYGSGDVDTDDAAIGTAVAALNSAGRGTLWIDGEVYCKTMRTFTAPIRLRGRGSRGHLKFENTATTTCFLWDAGCPTAPDAGHYTIAASAGNEYFTTSAFTPARGDYVVLYSTDQIAGVRPHNGVGTGQYPGEIHRVERWDSGTSRAYLDSPIIDTLATGAKAVLLNNVMLNDVVIENLEFTFTGGTQPDYANVLYLRGVNHAVIENIHVHQDGAGAIFIKMAMNCRLSGICIDGIDKNDGVYGFLIGGGTNGLTISDFEITGTRHAFTTDVLWGTNPRYGTPARIRVANGVVRVPSYWDDSSRVGLHTHAEGYDITFDGITVLMGDQASGVNVGAYTQSRNTTFTNCQFSGKETGSAQGGYAVKVVGPNCTITDCLFKDSLMAVIAGYVDATTDTYCNGMTVAHNVFRNIAGPAFWLTAGNNHKFIGNHCDTVGRRTGGTPYYEASAVMVHRGSGHLISMNHMPKGNNTYSIFVDTTVDEDDLSIYGNVLTGYTGTGFGGTAATAASAKYGGYNNLGVANAIQTAAVNDSSPSVAGVSVLKTANTSATNVDSFDDGVAGQRLLVLVNDIYTTFIHDNPSLKLVKGNNYAASSGNVLEFLYDGYSWWEIRTTS